MNIFLKAVTELAAAARVYRVVGGKWDQLQRQEGVDETYSSAGGMDRGSCCVPKAGSPCFAWTANTMNTFRQTRFAFRLEGLHGVEWLKHERVVLLEPQICCK